jgi:PAS domain S-box-containing protein
MAALGFAMSTFAPTYRILVIDDTASIHADFRKILMPDTGPQASALVDDLALTILGRPSSAALPPIEFHVDSAMQGEEGLMKVGQALDQQRPYAVAFVDMRMPPGWDGLETIDHLWAVDPHLQIVICTAYSDHSWAAISERIGPSDSLLILKKPFDHIEVLQLAHALCRKWRLTHDNAEQVRRLDDLVQERTDQLGEAEARFTEAFNASPLAQVIVDLDDARFLDINAAFERQFAVARSALPTLSPESICPELDQILRTAMVDRLRVGQPVDELPFTGKDAEEKTRHLRCSARAVAITGHLCAIVVIRDVTEQLAIEQQLRQSQKLEALGQLTAGIAHDFNNLLTVIHSYTSELLTDGSDPKTQEMLEPVLSAATRASTLVRQLLIFGRKEIVRPQTLDLCVVFDGLRSLLRRLISTHIAIEWVIPGQLPLVAGDPTSIEQIIFNLAVNARDAMPEGGSIRITARLCEIDSNTVASRPEARPGRYIEVQVSDTGTGIPPEVAPRIFEPFFTTKEPGKGTGLGLATVYSIVKQHGGWIEVRSSPGAGSTFTFYHPVLGMADQLSRSITPGPVFCADHFSPRHVLLVEDEPIIRNMLGTLLERRHIRYTPACDGAAALSLWNNSPTSFDLLISDIVMPNGVDGLRLARTLREQNSRIGVILMSGNSEALADPKNLKMPGNPPTILLKPFTLNQLMGAIAGIGDPAAA